MNVALRCFGHVASLGAVAAIAALVVAVVVPSAGQPLDASAVRDAATTTAGIAGTMVALVLPAAGLLAELIARGIDFSARRVFDTTASASERLARAATNRTMLANAQRESYRAWRGSLYVTCALVLALVALYARPVARGGTTVFVDVGALGLAVGFLVVGSVWLVVPAAWVLNFGALHAQLVALETEADTLRAGAVPPPSTTPAPPIPPVLPPA